MDGLVSVALATFNGKKYLQEQLDSIYNQTYKHIEVIVSDDASNDQTIDLLNEYKSKHGLKYYKNDKNLGFISNFQKAIEHCTGDYIALADQDDIWHPNKIEKLLKNIGSKPLICSDALVIDSNGNVLSESLSDYAKLKFFYQDQFKYLLFGNFVPGCTMLFKKELKEYILPISKNFPFHDWWIALVTATMGGIAFCDEPLMMYRRHDSNCSLTAHPEKQNGSNITKKITDVISYIKTNGYNGKIQLLKSLLQYNFFTNEYKQFIRDTIEFYEGMVHAKIPIKSTMYALRNRKYICAKRNKALQWIFALGTIALPILKKL